MSRHYADMGARSGRDRAILEMEFQEIAHGTQEERIRALFAISPARYYQLVKRLLEDPEAIAEWPVEVSGCEVCGAAAQHVA